MRNRKRYDSALVCLYALGKESVVPEAIRAQVPHSTASTWRGVDARTFIGHEVRGFQAEAIDHYALLCKHRALKRAVCTVLRVWDRLAAVALPAFRKSDEKSVMLMDGIQQLCTVMPRHAALRLARMSSALFRAQLRQLQERCGISAIGRCFKRHPLQLTVREIGKIKSLFTAPAYTLWPASSLYHQGWRAHGLHLARSTFYKYVRALGLQRARPKRLYRHEGLKATAPNQYLHVDTTHVRVDPEHTLSVAIVSENYSKAVLGFHIALNKGAVNVVAALRMAIGAIQEHYPEHASTRLVCDGGSENKAASVMELLLATDQPSITRIVAQEDIVFSNSPVEAINKILKTGLRRMKPHGVPATIAAIRHILTDYTHARPHGSLDGLIPFERYLNPNLKHDTRAQRRMAQTLRIAMNRGEGCSTCE